MGLLSTSAKNTIAAGARFAQLIELEFDTGIERYWSGVYPITYDGEVWTGVGGLGSVSPLESSEDFRANDVTMNLHGLPVTLLRDGTLTAADYKDEAARWIIAIMDTEDNVVWAKEMYYTIDVLTYAINSGGDSPTASIGVQLEHETTRAARVNSRRYSNADQTEEFPGDIGFEHLAYLAGGATIHWGSAGLTFK